MFARPVYLICSYFFDKLYYRRTKAIISFRYAVFEEFSPSVFFRFVQTLVLTRVNIKRHKSILRSLIIYSNRIYYNRSCIHNLNSLRIYFYRDVCGWLLYSQRNLTWGYCEGLFSRYLLSFECYKCYHHLSECIFVTVMKWSNLVKQCP